MPIYEYQCQKCRKIHEVTQRMTDAPLTKCPDCKGKMQKILSLSGFQLKGGGWYKDGYSSPKPEGTAKPAETPKPSATADAAPAAAPKAEKTESPKPAKPAAKKKSSKGKG